MSQSIPETQKAQVIEKTGGPVEFKDIPVQKPGPDEVLINIKYSGVCHTDLHAVNGDWPLPTKLPLVGGHEGAGVVVARGDLVKDIEIGEHAGVKWINGSCLACDFCQQSGESNLPAATGDQRRKSYSNLTFVQMSHCARRHSSPATPSTAPSSSTALPRQHTSPAYTKTFRSMRSLLCSVPVSLYTRV